MKKRIIALLCVGLVLTGCGTVQNTQSSSNNEQTTTTNEQTTTTEPAVKVAEQKETKLYSDKYITLVFKEPNNVFFLKNNAKNKLILDISNTTLNGHRISDPYVVYSLDKDEECDFRIDIVDITEAKMLLSYRDNKANIKPKELDETKYIKDGMNNISFTMKYENENKQKSCYISVDLDRSVIESW